MKKLTYIVFLLMPVYVLAQNENTSQSIELPDFVITGVQSIAIPEMEKNQPDVINVLSDDFFTPSSTPVDLALDTKTGPIKRDVDLYGVNKGNTGLLKLGSGLHTLPKGDFYFNQSFDNFMFKTHVWGSNTTEYIENAGYNVSGVSGSTDFFINNTSGFLPGLNIKLDGYYIRDSYKLYNSADPNLKRKTENAFARATFSNTLSEKFKYGISGKGDFLKFTENDFKEDLLEASGFFHLNFGVIGFGANGNYLFQDVRFNLSGIDNYTYYSGRVFFSVSPSEIFQGKFGLYYAAQDTNSKFTPFAEFVVKLDKRISLIGEYKPHVNYHTIHDIVKTNRYFSFGLFDNAFTEYNSFSKFVVKYQYDKYFEIDVGASFGDVDALPYFENSADGLKMQIKTINDITDFNAFLNLWFHGGPLGYFYGEVNYNLAETSNGNKLPHKPAFTSELTYGYRFASGFSFEARLNSYINTYGDLANTVKLNNFIDASLYFKYNLFGGFDLTLDLENILNREQFIWDGYQTKTFDIIGGIEYRW